MSRSDDQGRFLAGQAAIACDADRLSGAIKPGGKGGVMQNKLEDLANLAYERELNRELSKLQQHLELYRGRENKFFQMTDLKLKFMQETSDEILNLYDHLEPDQAVSRAVALGLLRREEIPQEMQERL
jgi:hypothetical protein